MTWYEKIALGFITFVFATCGATIVLCGIFYILIVIVNISI